MSETDGNYRGQSTEPAEVYQPEEPRFVIDRSGIRKSWVEIALSGDTVIVPISQQDDETKIARLMAAQGLGPENLARRGISPRNIHDHGWPEEGKS